LDVCKGALIQISKENSRWLSKEYLSLPSAPKGIALDSKNNFIIPTSHQLIKISNDKKISVLVENIKWWGMLDPQSICIYKNIAYVGMRKGAYRFDLDTKKESWLMKE